MKLVHAHRVLPVMLALFGAVTGSSAAAEQPQVSHRGLAGVQSYVVYYGADPQEKQKAALFDLVIAGPDTFSPAEILALQNAGVKVIAYLSVGEVGPNWYLKDAVDPSWVLKKNPNWGSFIIDFANQGWHDLLLNRAIPDILSKGYDGLFLDTVDSVDVYPQKTQRMADLILAIRKRYPDLIIVQNRGLRVLEQTGPVVDGVMIESFSSTYDFQTKAYLPADYDASSWKRLQERFGFAVLALDYALPSDIPQIRHDYQRAREWGFLPYVSTIMLDQIYVHDVPENPVKANNREAVRLGLPLPSQLIRVERFDRPLTDLAGWIPSADGGAKVEVRDGRLFTASGSAWNPGGLFTEDQYLPIGDGLYVQYDFRPIHSGANSHTLWSSSNRWVTQDFALVVSEGGRTISVWSKAGGTWKPQVSSAVTLARGSWFRVVGRIEREQVRFVLLERDTGKLVWDSGAVPVAPLGQVGLALLDTGPQVGDGITEWDNVIIGL